MTFKKKHKKYPKRTNNEIQSLIIQELEKFPRSTYAISSTINADRRTILRNLTQLESLNKVRRIEKEYRPKLAVRYWSIER